jgi:antitoxin component YwqK of YwqJK toxin-antitoxin module
MKTPIIFLTLIAVFFSINSSFAQPGTLPHAANSMLLGVAGEDYNLTNNSGEKEGAWIRVWPNGSLYYKGVFSNGEPDGSFLYFYETGELMSALEHGANSITAIHYRESGSVQASGNYIPANVSEDPLRDGEWAFFDENSLQRRLETYSNGELDGEYWVKDYQGMLVEEGGYLSGKKQGLWTAYYDNGNIRQRINYLEGELEGSFISYHPNNIPKIKGQYLEGREDGSWKTYADSGELELIVKYQYGKRVDEIRINGMFEDTFIDGRSKSEYTYRDKLLDGPYRVWFDCGEYIIEAFQDPETGEQMQKRVLIGTQVQEEGSYLEGKLDGPRYIYDIKGKIISKEVYLNGELQN